MKKTLLVTLIILILIVFFGYIYQDDLVRWWFSPQEKPEDVDGQQNTEIEKDEVPGVFEQEPLITVIAENLEIPWDIEFLPDGDLLVTERPGTLTRIDGEGVKHSTDVSAVSHEGEGGLLGLALHPNFSENNFVYIYITSDITAEEGSGAVNRVLRYVHENDQLSDETIIVDDIPGALFHNGGAIDFGPDGHLYITTGDAREPDLAQDTNSLAGKILRVGGNGEIPDDNPFGNEVWSYGHRNPQGLAWDNVGDLWSTEHGRSGLLSGLDELNLVQRGSNYGWPDSQGDEVLPNTVAPTLHSGPDVTWAPASLTYIPTNNESSLFFGGLRGETLYRVQSSVDGLLINGEYFAQEFGRIRAAVTGPDNMLYISTSNLDGRGEVRDGDDKILRINPNIL